jgi:TolA-binding protein
VWERYPSSIAAPEALYWKGVALYHKQDKDGMLAAWKLITAKHPQSFWGQAITFVGQKS